MTSAGQHRPAAPTSSQPATATDLTATMPQPQITLPVIKPRQPQRRLPRDRFLFLIAFLVALTVLYGTNTGRIFFDTKLGVDLDAREFLLRLWSLWNPQEWLGSLQDQYIGYAIPMAPFFLVGQLLHVPIWLIERLWLSLLLAVGFTGMVKLARALDVGSDTSRLLAGSVFALWPTFTILIGSTSASALPGLVAPWAILPLVLAVKGRYTAGRAAALSGLAVAAMSGVNAVCTLAVLVLPAVYILTHTRSRQRLLLGSQWAMAVLAGTAWWALPLLLQGRYAFNFLPYIEQSATTTRTLSAATVLRGTGTWTAYFSLGSSPWLAAGWAMVTSAAGVLGSAVVSAIGLAGLARRDMPERRWLCICVGLVVAVALAPYYGPLGGPWHAVAGQLLDGTLAPFRSLYKIEPVIGVALALGCTHIMPRVWTLRLPLGRYRLAADAITAPLLALTMIGLAWPQLTGQTLEAGSFQSVPAYWHQIAAYLAQHSARNTALVVPADPHGQFSWGNTIDDPLEPLATSPWVERGLVPYGGPGSQDLLATAEQSIESGQQVPGLAAYLSRAGIRYVVVRNDIAPTVSGYTPPQVANESLVSSGFRRVAAFGPAVAAAPSYPVVAGAWPGFALKYPAVEVFEAADSQLRPASPVTSLPVRSTVLVNGGPDSLLQLGAQDVLGSQPTVIAGQHLAGNPALWAVTDGQRRADNEFGATAGSQSYTYTATGTNPVDDPLGGAGGPPRQLLPVPAAGHQTVAVLTGAASVTASSAGTWFSEAPQYDPANAFDGSPSTAWAEASPATPVGQWIQVNFGHEMQLPSSIGIRLLDDSPRRAIADELQVTTAAGTASTYTEQTGGTQRIRVPPGPTNWLRITILGADRVKPAGPGAGIADVLIPGVKVTTYLQPAEDLTAGVRAAGVAYSFAQQPGPSDGSTGMAPAGQHLNRVFVTPSSEVLTTRMTATPVAGPALARLLSNLTPAGKSAFRVTADSTWDSLPVFGPDSMYAPARLPWISRAGDRFPRLTFSWHGRRTIKTLVLRGATGIASTPTSVLIGAPHAYRLANVGMDGVVQVSPPLRTDKLYLVFRGTSSAVTGRPAALPVGLASVSIHGLTGLHPAIPAPNQPFQLKCGQGPTVTISGRDYPTSVAGTVSDLIDLQPVQVHLCSPGGTVTLAAGQQRLSTGASGLFTVTGMSLSNAPGVPATAGPASPGTAAVGRQTDVLVWGADDRVVRVGPGPATYLEVHENADAGWTATLNGHRLQAATLDGWQQAYIVPAGQGGTIKLSFQPARIYHAGLIVSAILLLLLIAFALGLRWRRLRPGRVKTDRAQQEPHGMAPPATPARKGLVRDLTLLLPLVIVVALAAGPIAIAVPALAVLGSWRPRWLPYIAGAAMLLTGVVIATSRVQTVLGNGPFSATAQALALIALTAALMPAVGTRLKN